MPPHRLSRARLRRNESNAPGPPRHVRPFDGSCVRKDEVDPMEKSVTQLLQSQESRIGFGRSRIWGAMSNIHQQ